MGDIIISSKQKQHGGRREFVFFAVGALLGIFLMIYSIVYAKKAIYLIFGAAITALEVIIYMRSRTEKKTYIEVCENGIKGISVLPANMFMTSEFSIPFNEVKSVQQKENMTIVITTDSKYTCLTGEQQNEIRAELISRINKE